MLAGYHRRDDNCEMSRFSSSGSYDHAAVQIGFDHYRLHWTVDRYVNGSRLRFPTGYSRDTDLDGAQRFAKKWEIAIKFIKFKSGDDRQVGG
jgi:hypothetical protein